MSVVRPAVCAIVLAGGRGSRFGGDKLSALVGGRPLLDHAVLAAAAVARHVIVVGGSGPARLPEVRGSRIRRVADSRPSAGPLAGIGTGLALADTPYALVVAGDMPTLVPPVLDALVDALDASDGVEAAALLSRGRREPLPLALRVAPAVRAVEGTIGMGQGSLHALLDRLTVRDLDETTWRRLDPAGDTLRDVDLPGDVPR